MRISWLVLSAVLFSFLSADAFHFGNVDEAGVLVESGKKDEDKEDEDQQQLILAESEKKDDDEDDEEELNLV